MKSTDFALIAGCLLYLVSEYNYICLLLGTIYLLTEQQFYDHICINSAFV